ncbi:MAG: DUF4412 domain-containing protein [Acidobacteria bacterium]|nr:DUF4412 domain-containing protein [Acidobacteriota bacterium]
MKRILQSVTCLIALFSYAATIALAGVVIQQEGGEVGGGKPKQKTTVYIQAGKMRVEGEAPDAKKFAMIFDDSKQVMWMLSPDEGVYRELTASQVQQMGQQMNAAMQQMQAQLAGLPPDQRKMVEDMMKGKMGGANVPPQITVQEKGSGEKIGSFTTTRYAVLANGQLSEDIWAASLDQLHLQDADFKTFQAMAKFYEPLARNAPKGSWSAPTMQQIKGMPVRTVTYDGGRPAHQWDVLAVQEKSLDNGLFTLPAGLKKQEMMPGMGAGRGMGRQ